MVTTATKTTNAARAEKLSRSIRLRIQALKLEDDPRLVCAHLTCSRSKAPPVTIVIARANKKLAASLPCEFDLGQSHCRHQRLVRTLGSRSNCPTSHQVRVAPPTCVGDRDP